MCTRNLMLLSKFHPCRSETASGDLVPRHRGIRTLLSRANQSPRRRHRARVVEMVLVKLIL